MAESRKKESKYIPDDLVLKLLKKNLKEDRNLLARLHYL